MTEQKFGWRRDNLSAVRKTPRKDPPGDTSKAAPAPGRAPTRPENRPAEAAPAPKP